MNEIAPRVDRWKHDLDKARADVVAGRTVDGAELHQRLTQTIADLDAARRDPNAAPIAGE